MIFPLADVSFGLATLISQLVHIVVLVILVYVLLDLARSFGANLPEPVIAVHHALGQLCEPLFAPIRKVLPPMGGIDFSPLITMILIQVIGSTLVSFLA